MTLPDPPIVCTTCGRNIAHDPTIVSEWVLGGHIYYCTTDDPRKVLA